MNRCRDCDTSGTCRIPEELGRLARVRKVIGERGSNPWLEARIAQYMAIDVCLASLFGLSELHAKALDAEAALLKDTVEVTLHRNGQALSRHIPHQSVALEITLQRHQLAVA